ncbi:MAG: diacylglycerol/lipid kinase family protein, partial [Bacteroidota bacterium]
REEKFFLEGFGFGVFPKLMKVMESQAPSASDDPDKKIRTALELLLDIVLSYKARHCEIDADDTDYSGKFILAEIMNIRFIGPNLDLAPFADPGDGKLDLVLVSEAQRDGFAAYLKNKINGIEIPFTFNSIKAKRIDIFWHGRNYHVDDQYHRLSKPHLIKVELLEGVLDFLAPRAVTNKTNA